MIGHGARSRENDHQSLVYTSDASTSASIIRRRSNTLIISAFCLRQINTLLRLRMLLALLLASLVKTRLYLSGEHCHKEKFAMFLMCTR